MFKGIEPHVTYIFIILAIVVVAVIVIVAKIGSERSGGGTVLGWLPTATTVPATTTANPSGNPTTTIAPAQACTSSLKKMTNVKTFTMGRTDKCSSADFLVDVTQYITATIMCSDTATNGLVTTKTYNPMEARTCSRITLLTIYDRCELVATLKSCL